MVILKFSFLHSTACNFIDNERLPVHKIIQLSFVIPTICIKVCMFPCPVNMWANVIRYTTKAKYNNAVWKRLVLLFPNSCFVQLHGRFFTKVLYELVSYENSSCG